MTIPTWQLLAQLDHLHDLQQKNSDGLSDGTARRTDSCRATEADRSEPADSL